MSPFPMFKTMFHAKTQVDASCMFQENTQKNTFYLIFQCFQPKKLINCVSLFLMLFSMFRSESLAIACSDWKFCPEGIRTSSKMATKIHCHKAPLRRLLHFLPAIGFEYSTFSFPSEPLFQ